MFESVIVLLNYICLFVALAYVVLWVLGKLGIELPPKAVVIFWVIVTLVVLYMLVRMLRPVLPGI